MSMYIRQEVWEISLGYLFIILCIKCTTTAMEELK